MKWWSIPDRVYAVHFTSNLVDTGFTCIASNIPAEPCLNTYDDTTTTEDGFYRVFEHSPDP